MPMCEQLRRADELYSTQKHTKRAKSARRVRRKGMLLRECVINSSTGLDGKQRDEPLQYMGMLLRSIHQPLYTRDQ